MRPIGGSTEIYNKQPQALLILDNLNVSLKFSDIQKQNIFPSRTYGEKSHQKMENSQDITPFFKKKTMNC